MARVNDRSSDPGGHPKDPWTHFFRNREKAHAPFCFNFAEIETKPPLLPQKQPEKGERGKLLPLFFKIVGAQGQVTRGLFSSFYGPVYEWK